MCIVGMVRTAAGVRSVEDLGASGKFYFLIWVVVTSVCLTRSCGSFYHCLIIKRQTAL